jgi:hypothetical protein
MTNSEVIEAIHSLSKHYRTEIPLDEWVGMKTTSEERAGMREAQDAWPVNDDASRLLHDVEMLLAALGRLLEASGAKR